MPLDLINLGTTADDRTGDTFRAGEFAMVTLSQGVALGFNRCALSGQHVSEPTVLTQALRPWMLSRGWGILLWGRLREIPHAVV